MMSRHTVAMSVVGILLALSGVGLLFGLFSHGYDASAMPGVFIVQGVLVAINIGVYIAWQHGSVVVRHMRGEYLKRSFPNQPWLWRLDWSRRVSIDPVSTRNLTAWVAAAWNLGVTPLAVMGLYTSSMAETSYPLSALSIVIGAGLFGYAVYRMWYRAHVDNPPLRLHTNPARPGQAFECTLGTGLYSPDMKWTSELVCVYTRVESVKRDARYTTQTIVEEKWRGTYAPLVARSPRGTALALKFMIPKDAPASGSFEKGHCRWVVRVEARNKNGFVKFKHQYDVPMLRHVSTTIRDTVATAKATAPAQPVRTHVAGLELVEKKFDITTEWQSVTHRDATPKPTSPVAAARQPSVGRIKPMPELLGSLKSAGILFTAGGVVYPDALWDKTPLMQLHAMINRWSIGVAAGSSLLGLIAAAFLPWYCAVPFVLSTIAAGLGYAFAFYVRHHRYSVIFGKAGIIRRSRFLKHRWEKTIPWTQIRSIVWKTELTCAADGRQAAFRQLVINPDHRATRLTLSPAIGCRHAIDALVHLFDGVTRHRQ